MPDWTNDQITNDYLNDEPVAEEYTSDQEDMDMDRYYEEKNDD